MSDPDIEVDGMGFEVEKFGRERHAPAFEVSIQVEESRRGTPNHEFRKVVQPGGRNALTDEYLETKLQKWADAHPDYTIEAVGVTELLSARTCERIDHDD